MCSSQKTDMEHEDGEIFPLPTNENLSLATCGLEHLGFLILYLLG